jgi:hypothetical protein
MAFPPSSPMSSWLRILMPSGSLSECLIPNHSISRSFPPVYGLAANFFTLPPSQPFLCNSKICFTTHSLVLLLPESCLSDNNLCLITAFNPLSSMSGSMLSIMLLLLVSMVSSQMVPMCATTIASQCTVTFTAEGTSQIGPTSTVWGAMMTTYLNVSVV